MTALVLLPGLNNTSAVFDDVVAALPAEIAAFAPTLPALDTVEALADDVLSNAPEHFHLVGFSFGAYVAMAVLEKAPERVRALALIGAGPQADPPDRRAVREAAIEKAKADYAGMVAAQAGAAFHSDSLTNDQLMAKRANMVAAYGVGRFIAHTRAAMDRPDRTALLAQLDAPLLLMAGETDPLAPEAMLRELATRAHRSDVRIIPRAGHLAPMEQPELVAAHISSWTQA